MGNTTIRAADLVKTYGEVTALDRLDLEVVEGTVLGMLGPNGAGKTTTVRVLTTLLQPDSGRAEVAGIDVLAEPGRVRELDRRPYGTSTCTFWRGSRPLTISTPVIRTGA